MCYTYDKSKGGDTRELQSRMVPSKKKKQGRVTLMASRLAHLKKKKLKSLKPTTYLSWDEVASRRSRAQNDLLREFLVLIILPLERFLFSICD